MDKNITPPSKPPRVSVPVSAEVLEVFQRLAKAGNMSTGKAMAEWLNDTVEAAEFMAATMEKARAAPKVVMREMHAYALGLADETGELMRQIARKGEIERSRQATAVARKRSAGDSSGLPSAPLSPPLSNTGGKVPKPQKSGRSKNPGFPLPPAKVQAYADTNGVSPKRGNTP